MQKFAFPIAIACNSSVTSAQNACETRKSPTWWVIYYFLVQPPVKEICAPPRTILWLPKNTWDSASGLPMVVLSGRPGSDFAKISCFRSFSLFWEHFSDFMRLVCSRKWSKCRVPGRIHWGWVYTLMQKSIYDTSIRIQVVKHDFPSKSKYQKAGSTPSSGEVPPFIPNSHFFLDS